jgi:hypothetical protein
MNNMKKIFGLFIILLAFTITSKVYALEGRLILECDSYNKKVGETISCVLYGNSSEGISAVETKLVYNNLSLSNITIDSGWQGDYENKSLLLYTDTNKTGKFELMRFNVTSTVAGPKNFTFSDSYFTDSSFIRNQILNPDYTLTFVSDEEASNNDEQTSATIVDENTPTSNSQEGNKEEIENPDEGSFLPLLLVIFLSTTSVVIYFKTKNKKIFKL